MTKTEMLIAAACVTEAARTVEMKNHERAFLRETFDACVKLGTDGGLSWEEFSALVVTLHRAGALRLTRCDLVAAFGADRVEASEVSYLGATFHFVALAP